MRKQDNPKHLSVGMAATSGILWTMLQTICGKASLFIGQLILAKILSPEDFGIIGLAYTIAVFFGILSDIGIGQTLQQRQPRIYLWATQAFWISLAIAILVTIAMIVYAPIGGALYHNDKIVPLVIVLALNMPLSALLTVPQAQLQSLLKFNFIATYGSLELIATQLLTILFALNGFGALSFALPIPLLSFIRVIVYWIIAPVKLRPHRFFKGWSLILKRSYGIFGSSVLSTAVNQGDYITLGLIASTHVVGIYYFAFKLAAQPMVALATAFTNVLRPALVALKSDRERQKEAAVRTAELLGLLIFPLCFLQIAIAKPGLVLLFGHRWIESVPLIQILSIGLPMGSISWAAATLLAARGQNAELFRYQLISTPFFFVLIGIGALMGSSLGVAIGVTIYYVLQPLVFTILIFSQEGVSIKRIFSLFYTPLLLAFSTIGGVYVIVQMPIFSGMLLAQIVITTVLGGGFYILAVRYFSRNIYDEVCTKLSKLFGNSSFLVKAKTH